MSMDGPGKTTPFVSPTESGQPMEGDSDAPKHVAGAKRGRQISETEGLSLIEKRRRKGGKRFSIANIAPIEIHNPPPSFARSLSSPGRLSGEPLKTPVSKETALLWSELKQNIPHTAPCPLEAREQFPRSLQTIPEATALQIDGHYLPHNRVTFSGSVAGIAAMGPTSKEQTDMLFKTAIQEDCVAVVNIANIADRLYTDYPPFPKAIKTYGETTVTNISKPLSLEDPTDRYQFQLSVQLGDKTYPLQYHWLGTLASHHGGSSEDLLDLAKQVPEGKLLVHCKNGTGRTAMFMLILELRHRIDKGLKPEELVPTLKALIQEGRQCRGEFLEIPEQLQTVLNAAGEMLKLSNQQLTDLLNSGRGD